MHWYFKGSAMNDPKVVSVTCWMIIGSRAILDITGTNRDDKKITGVVVMKKTSSDWRVVDQNFFGAD